MNTKKYWSLVKLGKFVFHEKGRKPFAQQLESDDKFKHPYVDIEAFEKGIIKTYTDGRKCNFCSENDFLMVWDGARSGLVGKGLSGALGSTLMRINFPGIENDFAFYFLRSKYLQINTRAKGTGTPHVDPSLLWNYDFPIAPLPEQRAIVSKIEQLFSSLDNGIANLKAAQAKLEIYRQAVLKKAFEGELTGGHEKWQRKTLRDILKIRSGNGLSKANRDDDGTYFVYGGNGITGRHSEFMFKDRRLIIGRVGVHCGNTHITEPNSWITDNAFVVEFDKSEITLDALYFLIKFLRLNQFSSSTAQPVISGGKLYPIQFNFPPKEIQIKLVQEIETRLSVCDKVLETIEDNLKKAEALRQSILKKAFEGKLLNVAELEACRREPDWEPAEVLLKRIRHESLKK